MVVPLFPRIWLWSMLLLSWGGDGLAHPAPGAASKASSDSRTTSDSAKFDSSSSTWIDIDTAEAVREVKGYRDNDKYKLVFSDEFEKDGRQFDDGSDYRWTALDRPDTVNAPLQYYKPEMVTTSKGYLNITTTNDPVTWKGWNENLKKMDTFTRHYSSGMVQGWNKFCFTGGVVELSVQLPGPGNQPGLWPAAWLMGNLGRATYQDSTHGTWPYSFDHCLHDGTVTGIEVTAADEQRLSACDDAPPKGLVKGQGRGAPEVDILEAMAGPNLGILSHSLQVAPPLPAHLRPAPGTPPGQGQWYDGLRYGEAAPNTAYYGADGLDAISANSQGSVDLYENQHVFRLEWTTGDTGGLRWYQDEKFLFEVPATSLQKNYDGLPSRLISEEPMYLLLNTAMSNTWSPLCQDPAGAADGTRCPKGSKDPCCLFPAHYLVDYVRVYQRENDASQTIGCDPPSHPTSQYIAENVDLYGGLPVPVKPRDRMQSNGTVFFQNFVLGFCVLMVLLVAALMGYQQCGKRAGYTAI